MKSLTNKTHFFILPLYFVFIIYEKPLLAQSETLFNNDPFNYLLNIKSKPTITAYNISIIKYTEFYRLKSSDIRPNKSRKIGKVLAYIGGSLLVSSIFINHADKQVSKTILLTGVAIAPVALYFSINGRAKKDYVPKTSMAYVEKPLTE